jgi:hypothetical protein
MPLSFLIINPPFAYRRAPGISWSPNDSQLAGNSSDREGVSRVRRISRFENGFLPDLWRSRSTVTGERLEGRRGN